MLKSISTGRTGFFLIRPGGVRAGLWLRQAGLARGLSRSLRNRQARPAAVNTDEVLNPLQAIACKFGLANQRFPMWPGIGSEWVLPGDLISDANTGCQAATSCVESDWSRTWDIVADVARRDTGRWHRVLLIDCNFRTPDIHLGFRFQTCSKRGKTIGLTFFGLQIDVVNGKFKWSSDYRLWNVNLSRILRRLAFWVTYMDTR